MGTFHGDAERFDALTRALGAAADRRGALRVTAGAGLGGILAALGLDASAKPKKKKVKKKKKGQVGRQDPCPPGRVLVEGECAKPCIASGDCGEPPVYCWILGPHRVCAFSDTLDPKNEPPCPTQSSSECVEGALCIEFAFEYVCLTLA